MSVPGLVCHRRPAAGVRARSGRGPSVPDLDSFLPPPGDPTGAEAVRELARVALELRWAPRRSADLDDYLARYPELTDPEATRGRRVRGLSPADPRRRPAVARQPTARRIGVDVTDWPGPERRSDLAPRRRPRLTRRSPAPTGLGHAPEWPTVRICRSSSTRSTGRTPEPGDTFLGFKLIRELGRGASAACSWPNRRTWPTGRWR